MGNEYEEANIKMIASGVNVVGQDTPACFAKESFVRLSCRAYLIKKRFSRVFVYFLDCLSTTIVTSTYSLIDIRYISMEGKVNTHSMVGMEDKLSSSAGDLHTLPQHSFAYQAVFAANHTPHLNVSQP